ncbi:MAG TPA: hypothetical protein VNZ45_15195 [Bacteroidia bacterium]|jgi:hypothetical protein|nr:hypothetical protein [Bacteroidia bacterium]
MKKGLKFDIIFIIALGLVLTLLSELKETGILTKLPFVTLLAVYYIGRYASIIPVKK